MTRFSFYLNLLPACDLNFSCIWPKSKIRPYHAVHMIQRKVSGIFSLSFARIVFESLTFGHFCTCHGCQGFSHRVENSKKSAQISIKRISTYRKLTLLAHTHIETFSSNIWQTWKFRKDGQMHFFATTVSLSRSVWFRHFPTLKHNNRL